MSEAPLGLKYQRGGRREAGGGRLEAGGGRSPGKGAGAQDIAHGPPPETGASLCHLDLGGGQCREVTRYATGALRLHRRSLEEPRVLSSFSSCSHLVHWASMEANQTKA